jgi:thioredoxin 1
MSFLEPINKADFDTLLKTTKTFLFLDFYADWCGPCKRMEPILEHLAKDEDFVGKLQFKKINADFEGELAEQFNVRGIPAYFLVETNENEELTIVKNWVGSQDPFKLKDEIQAGMDSVRDINKE